MTHPILITSRSDIASRARRVVIKLGTSAIMGEDGGVALSRFISFAESISKLRRQNRETILVSSGSIGLGAKALRLSLQSQDLPEKQACAAVGQSQLMALYSDAFEHLGLRSAQILLTEEDLSNRRRYVNLRNTMSKLLELGVIPVVNENDTVSAVELEPVEPASYRKVNFGDNDKLSALVASKIEAELLLILTNVDGLFSYNSKDSAKPKLIPLVKKITPEIEKLATDAHSKVGRGGMRTKLEAATIATHSGCAVVMANSKIPGIIEQVFEGNDTGTFFMPQASLPGKRRWIAYATTVTAALVVNEGARQALFKKRASLLPAGVLEVRGDFQRGDVVSILDEKGKEFARGIVNYSSLEARKISGQHSKKIDELIENPNYDALIKRENMALLVENP